MTAIGLHTTGRRQHPSAVRHRRCKRLAACRPALRQANAGDRCQLVLSNGLRPRHRNHRHPVRRHRNRLRRGAVAKAVAGIDGNSVRTRRAIGLLQRTKVTVQGGQRQSGKGQRVTAIRLHATGRRQHSSAVRHRCCKRLATRVAALRYADAGDRCQLVLSNGLRSRYRNHRRPVRRHRNRRRRSAVAKAVAGIDGNSVRARRAISVLQRAKVAVQGGQRQSGKGQRVTAIGLHTTGRRQLTIAVDQRHGKRLAARRPALRQAHSRDRRQLVDAERLRPRHRNHRRHARRHRNRRRRGGVAKAVARRQRNRVRPGRVVGVLQCAKVGIHLAQRAADDQVRRVVAATPRRSPTATRCCP